MEGEGGKNNQLSMFLATFLSLLELTLAFDRPADLHQWEGKREETEGRGNRGRKPSLEGEGSFLLCLRPECGPAMIGLNLHNARHFQGRKEGKELMAPPQRTGRGIKAVQ